MFETSEGGLFSGKRFILVGFGAEAEAQLSELVMENAGKILVGRSRAVAHYAIVPLLGCDVEATVDEVVTDTWLVRKTQLMHRQDTFCNVCHLLLLTCLCVCSGHVCGAAVCVAVSFSSSIHSSDSERGLLSSQRLCAVCQSVYWS